MSTEMTFKRITIYGLVQGIGFRPYAARLAQRWCIQGEIYNSGGAVRILASAPFPLDGFINQLKNDPPPLSVILRVKTEDINEFEYKKSLKGESTKGFNIIQSEDEPDGPVVLPADLPVCDSCISEMNDRDNRRYRHPLISCTLCGPRYSIIKKAPYDRHNTAMEPYELCPECHGEYNIPDDRRFHAQTVSCHHCGPQLSLIRFGCKDEKPSDSDPINKDYVLHDENAITEAASLINNGGILAVKGIGGYHFIASPFPDSAAKALRELKKREQKPFAICFPDIETIKCFADVSHSEEELLKSNARPIVLLEQRDFQTAVRFSPLVVQKSRYIGAFLPYTPVMVQLCQRLGPIIATSANLTDLPIINNEKDLESFKSPELKGILTHDRKIIISQDDSVAWIIDGKPQIIRRSRGYTPLPVYVESFESQSCKVLALGGDLKSAFCIQNGPFAYLSQYLGDLSESGAMRIYEENLVHLKSLVNTEPVVAACDLHPDYATTKFAESLGLPVIRVQHHHAHIAAVMAERGIDEPVMGVSFDGTGYGCDGTIWGGEFLILRGDEFERAGYLRPVPILSGDDSMRDCQKTATCYLHAFGIKDAIKDDRYPVIRGALEHGVNTIPSSSMGRLFDAVSSILGFCHRSRYEGEGAILLENAAYRALKRQSQEKEPSSSMQSGFPDIMPFDIIEKDDALILDSEPLIKDLAKRSSSSCGEHFAEDAALGFHNALCSGVTEIIARLRIKTGIDMVILSGGVFQNKIFTERVINVLRKKDLKVFLPSMVPVNDGGISLGQAFIAMKKLKNGMIDLCV